MSCVIVISIHYTTTLWKNRIIIIVLAGHRCRHQNTLEKHTLSTHTAAVTVQTGPQKSLLHCFLLAAQLRVRKSRGQ